MKRSEQGLNTITAILLSIIASFFVCLPINANENKKTEDIIIPADSLELSLITCSPRNQLYALYGHTAIRYRNFKKNEDWVFNYGVFDFRKSFFVLRFTFGITDYQLGVVPFSVFAKEYRKEGCRVTEQILNLTTSEKIDLISTLLINYRPENRIYRYNFLYDNCTTRSRDIIEHCIFGKVTYKHIEEEKSFRDFIHEKTINHPWAKMGNDLCLGFSADFNINNDERQFLPENLMNDFDSAEIITTGVRRPLVSRKIVLFDTSKRETEASSFATPYFFAYVLLAISIIVAVVEYRKKHTFRFWDIFLMTATGIAGLLLTALFVSLHPTTSTNLQILLLNPLPLFFVYKVFKRKQTIYWRLTAILLLLFFIGAFFQDYADGTSVLALCLLARCWINEKFPAHKQQIS